jgi:TPR repeat protein
MALNHRFDENNVDFIQGLKYELGDGVKVNHQRALQFYKKGATQGHFLSLLKVHSSTLRIWPTVLLTRLSFLFGVLSLIHGFFWIGLLISFFLSVIQLIFDYQNHRYIACCLLPLWKWK